MPARNTRQSHHRSSPCPSCGHRLHVRKKSPQAPSASSPRRVLFASRDAPLWLIERRATQSNRRTHPVLELQHGLHRKRCCGQPGLRTSGAREVATGPRQCQDTETVDDGARLAYFRGPSPTLGVDAPAEMGDGQRGSSSDPQEGREYQPPRAPLFLSRVPPGFGPDLSRMAAVISGCLRDRCHRKRAGSDQIRCTNGRISRSARSRARYQALNRRNAGGIATSCGPKRAAWAQLTPHIS
jgi:hypothetical protein